MSEEYEQVCMICRRSENVAGKMLMLPGGLTVCNDCVQNAINMAESLGFTTDFSSDKPGEFNLSFSKLFGNPNAAKPSEAQPGEAPDSATGTSEDNTSKAATTVATDAPEGPDAPEKAPDSQPSDIPNQDCKNSNIRRPIGFPGISFINLNDMMGGMPDRQRVKKKKEPLEPIDIKSILPPHKIKEKLDEYVIGQDAAKKIISVAVYNHYKRVATGTMNDIEIEKSNVLMIGPTGCGKTYLVKTLAKLLDVPLAIADATSLTEAGYMGDDIESVVSKLLAASDNDVERAERGIIFIDEIDKIAKKKETTSRDVSGESVQQGLLKLLEGAEVEVPVGANSKNAMVPLATVNTRNILFICGGAFPDLEEVIRQRLNKKTSIGYTAELKDKWNNEKNILMKATVEDIKKFGMIPEFVGRLPVICPMELLDKDMLVKILKEPKNAILKQYQKLLELDEVKLEFSDEALDTIAQKAMERDTGARALRAIIEEFMLDIMYEIPKDKNIGKVTITPEYINGVGGPIIEMRTEVPAEAIAETGETSE